MRFLLSLVAFAVVALFGSTASAQCLFVGGATYECSGNVGATTVVGTIGDDTFRFMNGVTGDIDVISGGGNDTLDFSNFTVPADVDLTASGGYRAVGGGLSIWLLGFDAGGQSPTVRGGAVNDILTGGAGADSLFGGDGDDTLSGGGGIDSLFGEGGADILTGGVAADIFNGGLGVDTRGDTVTADCNGDTLSGVETDLCPPPPVPTMSEWTMILFGLALAGGAAVIVGLRQRLV